MFSMDLLLNAVVTGVLVGCFYAAVSVGLSVSFGLLDVPHVAHPAFLILASYGVFFLNDSYDIDPLLAGLMITPLLFVFGLVAYRVYYETFEKRGSDAGVRGIAFTMFTSRDVVRHPLVQRIAQAYEANSPNDAT